MRRMRRIVWMLAMAVGAAAILAACGGKDANDVVKELDRRAGSMESYKGSGKMQLHGGETPQEYSVEVWYKKPNYYRIELTNLKKDVTQIVLRNDEGVFVLTPHLKKSFRFQSDWPNNQGQVYLYQTLVDAVLKDAHRQFTEDKEKDAYVFEVAGNYPNHSFARQKIWLNRDNYAPQHVEVTDSNNQLMVVVDFEKFEFNSKLDKEHFDMERNMSTASLLTVVPATAEEEGQEGFGGSSGEFAGGPDAGAAAGTAGTGEEGQAFFGIIEPAYTPPHVSQIGIATVNLGDTEGIVLRFGGQYNYTLVESRPQALHVTSRQGQIVDLVETYGVLTGEEQKTLTWTLDGVEYRLSSGDLPLDEMKKIAISVQGQSGK